MSAASLEGGAQKYEWGKLGRESRVAMMVGQSAAHPNEKFAELWLGTHPSLPSHVLSGDSKRTSLNDFLAENPSYFSAAHNESRFKGQVPFLLKILSIGQALSIQAHPDKALAEALHARDPKNYKDPNHKPELIVALTPFVGLCCFRPVEQVKKFFQTIPSLGELLQSAVTEGASDQDFLRQVMKALYNVPKAPLGASLEAHRAVLAAKDATQHSPEDTVFLRLCQDYPGDVGCWMVYILNLLHLKPGEGLFLSANEPHAYLFGEGVEVMATSDNVVRAGLTPKFMDVDTLLSMLTYSPESIQEAFRGVESEAVVQRYAPPERYPDFSLYRVATTTAQPTATIDLPTLGLGLVLGGEGTVNGLPIKTGSMFVCTPNVAVEAKEPLQLFIASTNKLRNKL